MNTDLKAEMLAELEAFAKIELRQPGDLSLRDITDCLNMTPVAARRRADALVEAGRWTTHRVKDGQHWMRIWRRAHNE